MQFPVQDNVSNISYAAQCLKNLKGRSFASINICSILNKLDTLRLLVQQSNLDVLAVNETHLTPDVDDCELYIDGYSLIRGDRHAGSGKQSGGGIMFYVSDNLNYEILPDSHLCTPNVECLWINIKLTKARPIYLCSIYRAPDASVQDSLNDIQSHMELLSIPVNADLLMLGDVNIDYSIASPSKRRLDLFLRTHGLQQLITAPTRITANSQTTIDQIWSNNSDQFAHRGCLDLGLSDHTLIFTSRKRIKPSKEKVTKFIRCYRHFDEISFAHSIASADWSEVFAENNVECATAIFHFILADIINSHLPFSHGEAVAHPMNIT